MLSNFPKIECPFIRQNSTLCEWDGNNLNGKILYLVTDQINPGYEWVFDDEDTIAVEKLDGTNVKIKTEDGKIVAIQNRMNIVNPMKIKSSYPFIVEAVFAAAKKGYIEADGEQCGEVIGPKLQGNPLKVESHIWYPFEKSLKKLRYKSFNEHERTLDNFSSWFKDNLKSLHHAKRIGFEDAVPAEGVIFYNLRRRDEGKTYMAKLRRDMFLWYFGGEI